LNISPGLISDIINYKKGFSKEIIRQLASLFKLSHEAFNRPYQIQVISKPALKKSVRKLEMA
jgi:HTH-type transcriptional regulator/antitoxin HigA